jgi:hypothetical protein
MSSDKAENRKETLGSHTRPPFLDPSPAYFPIMTCPLPLRVQVLIFRGIGGSYLCMFWAMTLLPGYHFATEAGGFQTLSGLTVYLTIASVPLAQSFYLAFTLATFIAQKIGASGNWPDPIGETDDPASGIAWTSSKPAELPLLPGQIGRIGVNKHLLDLATKSGLFI